MDLEQTLTKWTLSGTQIKRRGRCRCQIWSNIKQSGHYRNQIWAKIGQRGHYRGSNRAKWALSGVDLVQGWIWFEKWQSGVGVVHMFENNDHIVWDW